MLPDSRQPIHMGINFVIAPMPSINMQTNLKFQQSLIERGIEFAKVAFQEKEITIERQVPTSLVIRVLDTQPPAIGQLAIIAPHPGSGLRLFIKEAEAIIEAFRATWATRRQIVTSDVALRDLYESSAEHSFQELWERLLGQPAGSLSVLGWSIGGGGVRFVVPPKPGDPEPVEIQLRIESYLQDTKKIWVETIFKWVQPMPPDSPLDPGSRLSRVDDYIEKNVIPFIMRGA
jgi:hypothetical protein